MTVLVGGLLALLSEGANELGAEISFLDQWGFILFYLPAAILLMVGGIKCLKYQKMGVFLMLGAEGLYALGNILILGGEELDIVSALMWPVIWAIVWALPLMLASGDLE
ncbi:MAG: hypothetical protein QGI21_03630 [Candidatus Poseidoniaceae archaeon]|nr:hypothetical protein [Candidatus Poseidoniaceae archaeon]